MTDLPRGWAAAILDDLFLTVLGGDWGKDPNENLEDSYLVRCIRASELRKWQDEYGKSAAIRRLKYSSLEKRRLQEGDILVEVSGGGPDQAVGRTVLITNTVLSNDPELDYVCTNFFRFCRPSKEIQAKFLNWYLTYFYRSGGTEELQGGSNNLRNLRFPDFVAQKVPIPPLNEQRRIVEKIEAMFDEIDKGVESLRTARNSLGLYGQSLLKSAFEGRLTADWRVQNADKLEAPKTLLARLEEDRDAWYECEFQRWQDDVAKWESDGSKGPKPRKPETFKPIGTLTGAERAVLPKMPSSWVYVRLNDIAHIGSGMSVSKARKLEEPVETPYLRVANVQRGHLDLAEIKTMPVEKSQLSALCLRTWDILFNEGGDRDKLGRGWIWEDQVETCITQNHVFRATPFRHDKGWSEFVSQWGNSYGRDYFEAGGKQTTNLASINKTVLKALPVPICSPAEQAEITRLLNARLEAADALEAEIDAALTRADALRQSILKKAFSGQLVPQDPADEPASALLERIKTEKAERDQAAKRDRKSAPPPKSKARRPTLTDLIVVLEKQKGWISAAKAAQELGIGDGSTSDDVEAFFRQLKDFVDDGAIEVERRGNEDWLHLATAEVS
ncbi:hypothetical protein MARINON1_60122 [Marinobacter salarius]|jgi:type I restriction enzyme S subunit|uniref:restriction endonuclease subunit S n=1 Tax=Marinobacter salarius TaxID=1420917 RepID=UPI001253610C|nr:restriction endonuclease subunit S [Marinobacter salarius]VVS98407.1 Type I restriction enzyme, S subunit (modular protein) [Marinobacter salarius]VXC39698.1 hypothetical protein MARINON1_60122 [Marinobacter salarius]